MPKTRLLSTGPALLRTTVSLTAEQKRRLEESAQHDGRDYTKQLVWLAMEALANRAAVEGRADD